MSSLLRASQSSAPLSMPTSGGLHPRSTVPGWGVAALVGALLAFFWALTYVLGGTDAVAPHWFYAPIILAAVRFGHGGAAAAALAAGVLAGPLMPASVAAGVPQEFSDALSRAVFFVTLGQLMAYVVAKHRSMEKALGQAERHARRMEIKLEPHERAAERDRLANAKLRTILDDGAIRTVFQPIVDLGTGRIVGVEALSRFGIEPERPPIAWFVEAWGVGLGVRLEMAALQAALQWVDRAPGHLWLSVNVSPDTIVSSEFGQILPRLPADRLVFEVTEHARIDDYDAFSGPLLELRARGGRLAIDDAGAGFASLRHILLLRPELIKLDMTLIRGIEQDEAKHALASGLISFGRKLRSLVVAEGIETAAELGTLRRLGVALGQGYYLARPAPLTELPLHDLVSSPRASEG